MKNIVFIFVIVALPMADLRAQECVAIFDYYKRPLTGEKPVHLCERFKDKVVLVVNTASKCAYTDQYAGLEALYDKYKHRGLVVAGFPSNDFAGQEPGSEKQIKSFCRLTYGVQFPMFEKSRVRSPSAEPFYQHLARLGAGAPKWNFHKYLIDRQGNMVSSFPSQIDPNNPQLIELIEKLL